MNFSVYRLSILSLATGLLPALLVAQANPIALNRQNPHYFEFHARPAVLITSAEHYGALINTDFDFLTYLDALHADGLNLTRVFSGAYVEPQGAFHIAENTLAPPPGRYLCPWKRSNVPGYANGGNKFDLSQWDPRYFARLRKILSAAAKRHIVVEFTFFCPFYDESEWTLSPLNPINNINHLGAISRQEVYSPNQTNVLWSVEEKMVRKIIKTLKDYDNLIYEICNEPYAGDIPASWQHHLATVISQTEAQYKIHHLITQNIANKSAKINDPDPLVSVFNFHYASPPLTVYENFSLNKVIGNNETGFNGQADSTYRRVAWQFILAGGGLFNNLDYSFAAGHEQGTFQYPPSQPGGGSAALRKQLGYLKHFVERFDFTRLHPDSTFIRGPLPDTATLYVLSEVGHQYAAYITGGHQMTIHCNLPPGGYQIQWMNPVTGQYTEKRELKSEGNCLLTTPVFHQDLALRIVRNGKR